MISLFDAQIAVPPFSAKHFSLAIGSTYAEQPPLRFTRLSRHVGAGHLSVAHIPSGHDSLAAAQWKITV